MTVAAGIDVGNSTTEVVLARLHMGRIEVIGAARAPTRRQKGSAESLDGAVALVRRLERTHGSRVQVASVAPLRPVETAALTLPEPERSTGRLRVVRAGSSTAGGAGTGVGRPVPVGPGTTADVTDPVVAVVPAGTGFAAVLPPLQALAAGGLLAAVVLADDEGVLLANRLGHSVPVVDEVPAAELLSADLAAVEVQPNGVPLQALTDPLWLVSSLGLRDDERDHAALVASGLRDSSNAVVALDSAAPQATIGPAGWIELGEPGGPVRIPFADGHAALRAGRVGLGNGYALPPAETFREVDDLYTVDLAGVADSVLARAGSVGSRAIALAALHADAPYVNPAAALSARLDLPVHCAPSEGAATRLGALTTPGAVDSAVVVDLGGGTVDLVSTRDAVVAAGAGELMTVSVAALTGATRAAAEWVKRGPAARVEAPQLLLVEDGAREFLDRPAGRDAIGALVVRGPAGLLPFDRSHAPGEWRALRLRLKTDVLGVNVSRALRTLEETPGTVIVVGGVAGDDEVLGAVSRALPDGVAVGRGDAGGRLGHRYVVAYGLLVHLLGDRGRS